MREGADLTAALADVCEALGTALVAAPGNGALRSAWSDGQITVRELGAVARELGVQVALDLPVGPSLPFGARLPEAAVDGAKAILGPLLRDRAPTDLGDAYEALLARTAVVTTSPWGLAFVLAPGPKGTARQVSGSYYTPSALVELLLDIALEPRIHEAGARTSPDALLGLTVLDPACGSGHFLLGALRRLAGHLAAGRGDTSAEGLARAKRDVAARCLYGVDADPLAVALCRAALERETGAPCEALGVHVRAGDALLGAAWKADGGLFPHPRGLQ